MHRVGVAFLIVAIAIISLGTSARSSAQTDTTYTVTSYSTSVWLTTSLSTFTVFSPYTHSRTVGCQCDREVHTTVETSRQEVLVTYQVAKTTTKTIVSTCTSHETVRTGCTLTSTNYGPPPAGFDATLAIAVVLVIILAVGALAVSFTRKGIVRPS